MDNASVFGAQDNELRLEVVKTNSDAVIYVIGELDAYRSPELENLGSRLLGEGATSLTLDMARTTFLDSSGLRAMLTLRERLLHASGQFELANPTEAVQRLLSITGLTSEFVISSTHRAQDVGDQGESS